MTTQNASKESIRNTPARNKSLLSLKLSILLKSCKCALTAGK